MLGPATFVLGLATAFVGIVALGWMLAGYPTEVST